MRTRRWQSISAQATLFISALVLSGCHDGLEVQRYHLGTMEKAQCDVAMQVAYGNELVATDKVDNGRVFPSTANAYVISEPVCVKPHGQPVRIPPQITLHLKAKEDYELCADGSLRKAHGDAGDVADEDTCAWNLHFRHKYPLSFVFYTPDGLKELSEYLRVVRIYRNGSLAYRWLSNDVASNSSISGKHVLFIPGASLKGDLLPHLSGIDIRIIGSETTVDDSTLKEEIQVRQDTTTARMTALLRGAVTSSVFAGGTLKCELDGLKRKAEAMKCMSRVLVDGEAKETCSTTTAAVDTASCTEVPSVSAPSVDAAKTREFYKQLRSGITKDLAQAQEDAKKEIHTFIEQYNKEAKDALVAFTTKATDYYNAAKHPDWKRFLADVEANKKLAEFAASTDLESMIRLAQAERIKMPDDVTKTSNDFFYWAKMRCSGATLQQILSQADQLMSDALTMVDDADQLLDRIRKDAEKLRTDQQAQAQLFNDVFQSLQSTTSAFEQYANNPQPLAGESVLNMAYSDRLQWFVLAPWSGVAFHVDKENSMALSFNATNLVPIIDGFGVRWQFGRTRYADIRAGLGVAGMLEDIADQEDASTDKEKQVFSLIPQFNVGVANVRVGVGIVAVSGGSFDNVPQRLRYFVGADLFKIISGTNVAAW